MPFFLARFRKRYALLVGLCLSLTAVLVLSRFILIIDVEGNETVPTAQILSELRRQGLRVGVYGPGLDERDLAHEALLQLPDLSWMAINLHGTRAQVLVREAVKKPPAEDGSVVGDVVAESGGIVSHMEVLSGEAVCQEGDTVAAGDVLISGSVKLPGPKYGGGVDLGLEPGAGRRADICPHLAYADGPDPSGGPGEAVYRLGGDLLEPDIFGRADGFFAKQWNFLPGV